MEKYIIITEFGDQQDIRVGLKSCKNKCKRLRVYTIVDFSFIRTFAPSF